MEKYWGLVYIWWYSEKRKFFSKKFLQNAIKLHLKHILGDLDENWERSSKLSTEMAKTKFWGVPPSPLSKQLVQFDCIMRQNMAFNWWRNAQWWHLIYFHNFIDWFILTNSNFTVWFILSETKLHLIFLGKDPKILDGIGH